MTTNSQAYGSVENDRSDSRFKTAYWCDQRIQIRVSGPEGERIVRLDQPFARIGSHPSSDVVLLHHSIERRHLYLHATAQGVYSIDFRLRQETGQRLGRWVNVQRPLKLGPYKLFIQTEPAVDPTAKRKREWNSLVPSSWERTPILTFRSAGLQSDQYPIRRRLISIGSHAINNICISSRSVSDFHAILYWDNDKLWVVDLFAAAKTRLYDAEIDADVFDTHVELKVGRIRISHFWTADWQQIANHKSHWSLVTDPTKERSDQDSVAKESLSSVELPGSDGKLGEPSFDNRLAFDWDDRNQLVQQWDDHSHGEQSIQDMRQKYRVAKKRLRESFQARKHVRSEIKRLLETKESAAAEITAMNEVCTGVLQQIADHQSQLMALREDLVRERQELERIHQDRRQLDVDTNQRLTAACSELQRTELEIEQQQREFNAQQQSWQADRSMTEKRFEELSAALEQRAAQIAEDDSRRETRQRQFEDERSQWIQAAEQRESQWPTKQDELLRSKSEFDDQRSDLEQARRSVEQKRLDAAAVLPMQSEMIPLPPSCAEESYAEFELKLALEDLQLPPDGLDAEQQRWLESQAGELQQLAQKRSESERLASETIHEVAVLKIEREKLEQLNAELEPQRQLLRQDRLTLERMLSTEYVQQSVLANLDRLRRENTFFRRVLRRLWPFAKR